MTGANPSSERGAAAQSRAAGLAVSAAAIAAQTIAAASAAQAVESAPLYRPSAPRPKSPHVTIYRWPITMTMSIAHRLSGAALYAGTVFLVIYLAALAWGETQFNFVQAVYSSFIGQLILFLYTLALVHHMVGGIRHLFWDVHTNLLEKHSATKIAWATVFVSIVLTILIWAVAYFCF